MSVKIRISYTEEAIVGKRLAEAKASNEAALSKKEEELKQREMQIRAKEILSERGLPKELANVLKYSDEKSLTAAIDVIEHTKGFKDSEKTVTFEGFRPIEDWHDQMLPRKNLL